MRKICPFYLLSLLAWVFVSTAHAAEVNPTEIVAAHNEWRAKVNVGGLAYSSELSISAQAWAEHLKTANQCQMQHSSSKGKYGENLFWASAWSNGDIQNVSSKNVVENWASEKSDYDYAYNRCSPGKVCGHYTQLVWKSTREVGCGVAVCNNNEQIWVCRYTPAGNWVGNKPY